MSYFLHSLYRSGKNIQVGIRNLDLSVWQPCKPRQKRYPVRYFASNNMKFYILPKALLFRLQAPGIRELWHGLYRYRTNRIRIDFPDRQDTIILRHLSLYGYIPVLSLFRFRSGIKYLSFPIIRRRLIEYLVDTILLPY